MAENDDSEKTGKDQDRDQDQSEDQKKQQEQERKHDAARAKSRPWVKLGLFVFIAVVLVGGFFYWWTTRFEESTDDAFTAGRTITIAPHVAGYVTELDVHDNQ